MSIERAPEKNNVAPKMGRQVTREEDDLLLPDVLVGMPVQMQPQSTPVWRNRQRPNRGGLLVASRAMAKNRGLDVDADDNALLAFRDDRCAGECITTVKVSSKGEMLCGPADVQLSGPEPVGQSPQITATSDGYVVAAWTVYYETPVEYTDVRVQRLGSDGVPQ